MAQAKPISSRTKDVGAGVVAGAAPVVMLQLAVAAPDAESPALTVKGSGPAVAGVPLRTPVDGFKVNPAGSEPVIE